MAIGFIIGGIGELFADLFIQDEEAQRAAKAAIWTASMLGGNVAGCAVMVATQAVGAAVQNKDAQGVVDTVGSVAAGGMTSLAALVKTGVGAGVGAAVGAAAGGKDGALKGMNMGASLMKGSGIENLCKAGGGLVGGGIGALAADKDDKGKAFEMGFSVGMAVGGAGAGMGASSDMAAEDIDLKGEGDLLGGGDVVDALSSSAQTAAEDGVTKVAETTTTLDGVSNASEDAAKDATGDVTKDASEVAKPTYTVEAEAKTRLADVAKKQDEMFRDGLVTLGAEAAAPGLAAAVNSGKPSDKRGSFLDTWKDMRAVASGAASAVGGVVGMVGAPSLDEALGIVSGLGSSAAAMGRHLADSEENARATTREAKEKARDDASERQKIAEISTRTFDLIKDRLRSLPV